MPAAEVESTGEAEVDLRADNPRAVIALAPEREHLVVGTAEGEDELVLDAGGSRSDRIEAAAEAGDVTHHRDDDRDHWATRRRHQPRRSSQV